MAPGALRCGGPRHDSASVGVGHAASGGAVDESRNAAWPRPAGESDGQGLGHRRRRVGGRLLRRTTARRRACGGRAAAIRGPRGRGIGERRRPAGSGRPRGSVHVRSGRRAPGSARGGRRAGGGVLARIQGACAARHARRRDRLRAIRGRMERLASASPRKRHQELRRRARGGGGRGWAHHVGAAGLFGDRGVAR